MPYSSDEGKDLVREFFKDKALEVVFDVGPGAGTYWKLLHPGHEGATFVACEIWGPYVEEFRLREMYDRVVIADASYLDWGLVPECDVVILGDVLEHMEWLDAALVMMMAITHSKYVVVSYPIVDYPQGHEHGNPYEEHRLQLGKRGIGRLSFGREVLAKFEGDVTGTYIVKGDIK